MPSHRALYDRYTVRVMSDAINMKISVCGLCGNCGILDTRETAVWGGKKVGVSDFCVCPNGQKMRKQAGR